MIEIVLCADLLAARPQGQVTAPAPVEVMEVPKVIYDRVPERGILSRKWYNFSSESSESAVAPRRK